LRAAIIFSQKIITALQSKNKKFMKHIFLLSLLTFSSPALFSQNKTGFIEQKNGSMPGYVLFAPLHSKTTYLIDKCGKQVHSWKSAYTPGQSAYLLPNGDLLRAGNDSNKIFKGGGRIEKFNWDNKLLWSYLISSATECQHHDICPLPNGNILVLVWEKKTAEEAIKAGRNPGLLGDCVWSEKIIELNPSRKNSAKVVWEWHAWDHLVQDHDSAKANYGIVRENRQLININFSASTEADWLHFNSIAYNPELDQVLISNRNFSEIFILDHSTSSPQAASHNGGRYNKGGDLLFRYGNAQAYNGGAASEQKFFGQHNAHWIERGLKDEGKIMLFNNGLGRRQNNYSSVDLIGAPVDDKGNYGAIELTSYLQLYSEKENDELGGCFFSQNVSSVQRLGNGNTLVCSGATGQFCELDQNNTIVWLYVNPVTRTGIAKRGSVATNNQVFRCTLYESSFSGFKGKSLNVGQAIEVGAINYPCAAKTHSEK
jgi:hypothetical protein